MSEHSEQCAVIEWAKMQEGAYPPLKWLYAVVNGAKLPYTRNRSGQRYCPQAIKLLKEGLKPGISDVCLPYPNGAYCGIYIELKIKPNKPTTEQLEFINYANNHGYYATVCYGAEQAINTLQEYLTLQPGCKMASNADIYGGKHCKRIQPK